MKKHSAFYIPCLRGAVCLAHKSIAFYRHGPTHYLPENGSFLLAQNSITWCGGTWAFSSVKHTIAFTHTNNAIDFKLQVPTLQSNFFRFGKKLVFSLVFLLIIILVIPILFKKLKLPGLVGLVLAGVFL